MPRGGKRKGAGAPKRNLNHIIHGERSKQIQKAIANALHDPEGRALINTLLTRYGADRAEMGMNSKVTHRISYLCTNIHSGGDYDG